MNLIITGGNAKYFDKLKIFVESLRTNGEYRDKIIVCDNTIDGTWDNPGKFLEVKSFNEEQIDFFKKYDVEIVYFHELLNKNNLSRDKIDSIPTYFWAYPLKFIYLSLISKEYFNYEKICFFDADIYFQKPIKEIFNFLNLDKINIVPEFNKIGKIDLIKTWMRITDFSFSSSQEDYLNKIDNSLSLCTGFFGSSAKTFNNFVSLCWILSSSNIIEFHNDQPLANILIHYFKYSANYLSPSMVLHIGELYDEEICYDGEFSYNNINPIAVHFNGGKANLMELIGTDKFKKRDNLRKYYIIAR
ncbi:hypothetical protein KY334_07455, partial [Candidatus Woesearchaeota archaeon]|nr:hypothetical protein [Candidatus Woesearchaeota archaeon]